MSNDFAWLEELDFPLGPPWLRMGMSRIPTADWLLPNDEAQLSVRRGLLDSRRDAVLASTEGAASAIEELAVVVANHLKLDDDAFVWDPLEQIGRAICEDFCVLVEIDGDLRLGAAVVCFPSHWRLAEKMGASVAAIHEPVPGYAEEISSRVDTFLDRLTADAVFGRRNWSLHSSDELFTPLPRGSEPAAYMRSERQTLRRLPETRAVVFTIRTQQAPLEAVWERPGVAGRFHDWVAAAPAELVDARCGPGWA